MITDIEKTLANMLSVGPVVLVLGQSYLRLEDGTDPFLNEVVRKYYPDEQPSYDLFLKLRPANSVEEFLGYLSQFNRRQTTPSWIK